MSKIIPENRMITKCEFCTYEIDTLKEDMYVNDCSEIMCILCHEDQEYDN